MNRPRAANQLVSCCTSFLEVGAGDSVTALSWTGLAYIPLWVIIKPKNFLKLTLNTHFKRLSFIP